jgi:hypothetical protein
MSHAISGERFSREGQVSRHEGEFENLCPNNLLVSGTHLIFQEKVVFEQREIRRNPYEGFTKIDKKRRSEEWN